METENKNPIQVADRLFGALEFLSQRNGYVQKDGDTGQYRLTSKITDLAADSQKNR